MAARFARRTGGIAPGISLRRANGVLSNEKSAIAASARLGARPVHQPANTAFAACSSSQAPQLGAWRSGMVTQGGNLSWHASPTIWVRSARYSSGSRQGAGTASSSGDGQSGSSTKPDSEESKHQASDGDGPNGSNEGADPADYAKALALSLVAGLIAAGATAVALSATGTAASAAGAALPFVSMGLVAGGLLALAALAVLRPALPAWLPAALLGAGLGAQGCAQDHLKARFRDAAVREAVDAGTLMPPQVSDVASTAPVREFETNRIHLEVEYASREAGTASWRFRAQAKRQWFWRPWDISFVEVACKESVSLPGVVTTAPPPQVRHWSSEGQSSRWRTVWHRGTPYAPGKPPRSS